MKDIIECMIKLHKWRERYNKDNCGYGLDEYARSKKLHYPEAYAKFAKGYLSLFDATGEEKFSTYARNSLEWLIKNKSRYYRDYSWGLPFKWDCVPKDGPYLLTTSFCGQSFLDFYSLTGETRYLKIVKSAMNWVLEELGGETFGDGFFFYYSPYKCDRYFIPNAVSISVAFLINASRCTKNPKIQDKIRECVRAITKFQNPDGSWHYSTRSTVIDNLHTAYTLEGLWSYFKETHDNTILISLVKGTSFLWDSFYEQTGYGAARVSKNVGKINPLRLLRDGAIRVACKFKLVRGRSFETRLWGYAVAIRAFTYASYEEPKYLENAMKIFSYVKNNLQDEVGYFHYRTNDESCFIRHQANIFEALGVLAHRKKKKLEIESS